MYMYNIYMVWGVGGKKTPRLEGGIRQHTSAYDLVSGVGGKKTPMLDPPSTSSTLAPKTEGLSLKKKKRDYQKKEDLKKKRTKEEKHSTSFTLAPETEGLSL